MWWWLAAGAWANSVCTPEGACFSSINQAMTGTTGALSLILTAGDYVELSEVLVPPDRELQIEGSGVVVLSSATGNVFRVLGGLTLRNLTVAAPGDAVIRALGGEVEVRECVLLTLGLAAKYEIRESGA